jgi:hypothetical protein
MLGIKVYDIGYKSLDIRKMFKVVEIMESKRDREVQIWNDIGFLENVFPKDKNFVEIIQELRKK